DVRRDRLRGRGRCAGKRHGVRKAHAGARSPGASRRSRNLLSQMFHPQKARVNGTAPKGRPEVSERAVMAAGKAAGLVDVKVVGFLPTPTGGEFGAPA